MEGINPAYNKYKKAYSALERGLIFFNKNKSRFQEEEKELLIAGLIKHFELCYEMSWKFLQQFLKYDREVQLASPKAIFRECAKQQILDEETIKTLLIMSDTRNTTTHNYDAFTAQEIVKQIENYFYALQKINSVMNLQEA